MGLFDIGGACTRSNTNVREKVSLSAGSLYAGGLYVEKYGTCSAHLSTVSTITLRKLTRLGLTGFRCWGTDHYFDV